MGDGFQDHVEYQNLQTRKPFIGNGRAFTQIETTHTPTRTKNLERTYDALLQCKGRGTVVALYSSGNNDRDRSLCVLGTGAILPSTFALWLVDCVDWNPQHRGADRVPLGQH